VKVTVDTNILVRVVMSDDQAQAEAAASVLRDAEVIAVPTSCLCEFVWVLTRLYKMGRHDVSTALHVLLAAANVVVDRPAVDAGLAVLDAGGDFADGVIAHEGSWIGGETFVSFDKAAVSILVKQGWKARLLA
jgi:predicted nucleic-acid-binding protein